MIDFKRLERDVRNSKVITGKDVEGLPSLEAILMLIDNAIKETFEEGDDWPAVQNLRYVDGTPHYELYYEDTKTTVPLILH